MMYYMKYTRGKGSKLDVSLGNKVDGGRGCGTNQKINSEQLCLRYLGDYSRVDIKYEV